MLMEYISAVSWKDLASLGFVYLALGVIVGVALLIRIQEEKKR